MREQLEDRLGQLRDEFLLGQKRLREIEGEQTRLAAEQAQLTETMLRIAGAIQVLEESLNGSGPHSEEEAPET